MAKKLWREETGRTRQGFIMFKTSYNSQVMIFIKQKLFGLSSEESVSYIFFFSQICHFSGTMSLMKTKEKDLIVQMIVSAKSNLDWVLIYSSSLCGWSIKLASFIDQPNNQSKLKPILNWSVIYPRLWAVCLLFLWILMGCLMWYFPQFALITCFDHCYWF